MKSHNSIVKIILWFFRQRWVSVEASLSDVCVSFLYDTWIFFAVLSDCSYDSCKYNGLKTRRNIDRTALMRQCLLSVADLIHADFVAKQWTKMFYLINLKVFVNVSRAGSDCITLLTFVSVLEGCSWWEWRRTDDKVSKTMLCLPSKLSLEHTWLIVMSFSPSFPCTMTSWESLMKSLPRCPLLFCKPLCSSNVSSSSG